ncbi:predicted protein [Histoplasma mississippiense (nom. inval.)]|uniref:predicted protein n=1 Tax=Ajellomyces capsulatus (strain NAm1 / WU24) TaxID=2059318 RepID=UPI000157B2E5|nr:predicted protein [Histoplasma mississippiense (nom. inval.)]EDN02155.1 predicted protein [Histoplasma mississippiense (nom. inval.)]
MSFTQAALDAENVASTFSKFVAYVPDDAPNITSVVTEFFTIYASLRSLETLHNSPLRSNFIYINNDVELVVGASLHHTTRVINEAFIAMDNGGQAQASQHTVRQTWMNLHNYFQHEAGYPLSVRLQYYKQMLAELILVVRNERGDQAALVNLRKALTILRMAQDQRYAADIERRRQVNFTNDGRTFGPPRPTTPLGPSTTFAPTMPTAPPLSVVPPAPPPPTLGARPRSNTPPLKSALRKPTPVSATPTLKRSYERRRPAGGRTASPHAPGWFEVESPVPSFESLDSPSTTDSTSTDSFSFLDPVDHWAVALFSSLTTTTETPLPHSNKGSKCYAAGFSMPDTLARLEKDFHELFRLKFEPNLIVILYLRARDHRARILCQVTCSPSKTVYATEPLNRLTLSREQSHLLLCTSSSKEQGLRAWLSLQFDTIEKMVLFHCAFIALRGQDSGHPISSTPDPFSLDEKEIYGGLILDDSYLHALRIFQDRASGVIRLQASIHSGEMADVPIWTAFIHDYIGSKSWMRRVDYKTIILSDLDRATFIHSDQYTPRITRHHEHVLTFTKESDAEDFESEITLLRRHSRLYK